MAEDFLKGFDYVGDYKSPEREKQRSFLDSFEYVKDVPTAGGYATEAIREVVREVPKAAIAAPLKGIAALQAENQRRANETLLFPMLRTTTAKLKDPKLKDEAISELESWRDSMFSGLSKDQKESLSGVIDKARGGETDPGKLLEGFEGIKPVPVTERAAYKVGKGFEDILDKSLKRTPGYEDSAALDIAGAIGSTGGSIIQGLVLGPAGLMATSALQGVDEQLSRAKAKGLNDEEAAKFAVQGAGPGAVGMLSVEFILRKVPPIARKQLLKVATDVAGSAAAEGMTEALQQVLQNGIEMQYNKDRGLLDGTLYEGVLGGSAAAVLRGVVLASTRGKGVARGGAQPDPTEVQRELAAEEIRIRQREEAEAGKPQKPPAETPAEAAKQGQTEVVGEPATVTWTGTGESFKGTIRKRTSDGGYEVVDQDGTVTIINKADTLPDPVTGADPLYKLETGWKKKKPDSEIEEDLKEFLTGDNPWDKVTVEVDGKAFKAIEGPVTADGKRTFKDATGASHIYKPEDVAVSGGWEPSALDVPGPIEWERDKAKKEAEVITPEDDESPLPNYLIRAGKALQGEAEGSEKANSILAGAGLPPVGTRVQYKAPGDPDKAVEAIIEDAGQDSVKLLTADGEIIEGKSGKIAPRITQIPVSRTEARTEQPEPTGIELPAFFGPGGRFEPVTKPRIEAPAPTPVPTESITPLSETRIPAPAGVPIPEETVQVSPDTAAEEPRKEPKIEFTDKGVPIGDNRKGRRQGEAGVEQGKDVGDTAKHEEGKAETAYTGVRDTEVKRTKPEEVATSEPQPTEQAGTTNVRENERQVEAAKKGPVNVQVSNAERPGVKGTDVGTERKATRPKTEEVGRGKPEVSGERVPEAKTVQEHLQAPKAQEGVQATAASWWDSASETDRRAIAAKSGYAESAPGGKRQIADEQGKRYAQTTWDKLPPETRTRILVKNADAIRSYSESAVTEPTRVEPAAKLARKARTVTVESKPAAVPQEGLEYRKNGQPFESEASAMLVVSSDTHEAVKVEGGWARRRKAGVMPEPASTVKAVEVKPAKRKPVVKKVAEEPVAATPAPETKVEKASPARRVTKKDYDAKRAAVNAQLRGELDRVGLKDVKLETPDQISEIEGKKLIEDSKVAVGRTTGNLIEVALTPERDYRKTLRHEALHSMRNLGLFKDAEWRTLERDAKSDQESVKEVIDRYAGESLTDEALVEEVIADKFADYNDGLSEPNGFIKSAYEKIRSFIKALGNALRGNGFRTASDVFQSIERGEVGARPRNVTTTLESKLQIQRAEEQADIALKELRDPNAGLVDEKMESRILDGDRFFVDDIGHIRKKIVTPRTIASFHPNMAPVYITAKHQSAFQNKVISDLGKTYKPYQRLKRSSKARVNKVLELGRLDQTVYEPDPDGTITVMTLKQTAGMKAGESITLTPDEVRAYQSVRDMMDQALGLFRDQIVRDFGFDHTQVKSPRDALALIGPKTPPSVRDKIQTLAKMMTEIQQSERTGYVPFTRFGNVVIVAKRINPNTGQYETLHSETVEVKGWIGGLKKIKAKHELDRYPEIRKVKENLAQRYPDADVRAFQVASREDRRPETERDMLTELLQLPQDQVAAAVQTMHTEAMAKGFRKHFFGSRNVPGYSPDLERSIADYVIGLAGYTARRNFHKEWVRSIEAIPSNMPKLKDYAENYRKYFNTPTEEYAALRQAGFIYFLAGNFSNAAINMGQVPLITAPYLNMFDNGARVGLELGRAYKDVLQMFGGGKKEIFNPDKAPADVRDALKLAWAENEFTPLAMFDIMGVAYNRHENMRSLSAAAREALDYVAILQTGTERMNRVVTYIAAYRMANRDPVAFRQKAFEVLKDSALASQTVLTDFSPDKFARYIVDETQYDVGKINRPELMRGPGAAIFQFKTYMASTIELQARLARIHGNKGKKAFALMLLGLFVTAGTRGLPFVEDAANLFELLYKWWTGIDADIRSSTRELFVELTGSPKAAEVITSGSTRLLGLDMTTRIGLGKILPGTTEEVGGVPFSLLYGKVSQTATYIKDGRFVDAGIEVMPLAAKNAFTALQWYNKGIRTIYGDPVFTPDEVTAGQVAAKVLGWTPSEVSERRAMEWAQQRAGKATQDMKTKYYRRMARAIADADQAAIEGDIERSNKEYDKLYDIIDEIQEHNDKAIEDEQYWKVFDPNDRALMKRVLAEEVGRGLVREQTAPKVTRPRMEQLREIYGDTR